MRLVSKKLGSDILEESLSDFILFYKMVSEGNTYIRQSNREHISATSPQMSDLGFLNLLLGGVTFPLQFFI